MGCAVSCMWETTMSLFGKHPSDDGDSRAKLERKLYLAKESPESDFDLSDCEMRKVPSGIYSICKVYRKDQLYLNDNNLQSLADGGQLSDLYLIKVLNISCNKFIELPNDIKYLVNLKELYLQDNRLKYLPDGIGLLQNLNILDVSRNKLKKITPAIGQLISLRKLNLTQNTDLKELCPELCLAANLTSIELDVDQFIFPPVNVISQGTTEIMKYLCGVMNIEYRQPSELDGDLPSLQSPNMVYNPFARRNTISWEEQEAAVAEQENKIHQASKQQRERFLTTILDNQLILDSEIAKIQETKDLERQNLIKAIQEDEREIVCLVKNFIQSDDLRPEVIQQQLAHEQAEHDRLLEITRQGYENVRRVEILKAMEALIEEECSYQLSKKDYENSLNVVKQSMLVQELESVEKLHQFLKAKDDSHLALVQQLMEDQDMQKAAVASLIERVDARSWSLNEEISLISLHLAKLSLIEQEKKKLQVVYNYNELLHQRMQLVVFLDDLLGQQNKRRKQLVDTLKEMERENDTSTDFWLKKYQKLLDSTPKSLTNIGKHLDPVFANYLLQEGVIHCLPFLVKFLFSSQSLLDITVDQLKDNGVVLSSDRDGIIRAINCYVGEKNKLYEVEPSKLCTPEPSASDEKSDEASCTGVVNATEVEGSIESECVVCMDQKCEVVFVPCGHMCCCQGCAGKEMDCCPMCRTDIERKIKVIVA